MDRSLLPFGLIHSFYLMLVSVMVEYVEFKDKFYCKLHKLAFNKDSKCPSCKTPPLISYGTPNSKKEIQLKLHEQSLTIHEQSRRVYVRKNIVERFHSYRLKFEAEVKWEHLFSYEEYKLNNNVKFKRIDFPEAIVRVFRKSILVTLRSSMEIKNLSVMEAKKRSDELILDVIGKLPSSIQVKDLGKLSSVHNAFVNHPFASKNVSVKVNNENRFISDNSKGHPEFEAINTNHAISDSEFIEQDIVSLIDRGLSRDVLAQSIKDLIDDRKFYAENLRSHVEAINVLARSVDEFKNEVRKDKIKRLKDEWW